MNILLIDNSSELLEDLVALVGGVVKTVRWNKIPADALVGMDLVVLSGGGQVYVQMHEGRLETELNLIRSATVPVIGICYGAQVIAQAFGGVVEFMKEKHAGEVEVVSEASNNIFPEKICTIAYENHSCRIKTLPNSFEILARSDHSIEAFRHNSKSIYGFQFHPEYKRWKYGGKKILERVFKDCGLA